MNLIKFNEIFTDEASCRLYLKNKREKQGIVCKKCNGTKHYWLTNVEKWRCANCKTCLNLRSGTIMEKSKLPVYNWFLAIHLVSSVKKSFSALEMQKQLGSKRYEPVWYMMHKIRRTMGKRDSQYKLKGEIEVDDTYFEIVDLISKKDELGNKKEMPAKNKSKHGRGTENKISVLVMVESKANPKQAKPHKKKRIMGYVKMKVIDDLNKIGINYEIQNAIDPKSVVITDGLRSYNDVGQVVDKHIALKVPPEQAPKMLPWVHTVISNAKRLFLGIHHSVNQGYIQNYLDEFCYKLNRRNFDSDLFDRIITAGITDTWY